MRIQIEEFEREQDQRELTRIMTCPRKLKKRLLRARAAKRRWPPKRVRHKRWGNKFSPMDHCSRERGWSWTAFMQFYWQRCRGIGDGQRADHHRDGIGMGKRGVSHAKKWLLPLIEEETR